MTNLTLDGKQQESMELSLCLQSSLRYIEDVGGSRFVVFNPYFFVSVNAILSMTSLLGNVLIFTALWKDSSLGAPSRVLLLCLSLTDLCVGLIAQPLFISYLMAFTKANWGSCRITGSLALIASAALCGQSIVTVTAISVDRLLALLLRLRYRQVVTFARMRRLVIISWIINFAAVTTRLWDERFFFLWCCLCIFLCLAISTCCYTKIYVTLRRQKVRIKSHLHGNSCASGIHTARYKKTVSSALWVHLTLIVCYLPYAIVITIAILNGRSSSVIAVAWNVFSILVYLNSTLNPVLYCWKIKEVRGAVMRKIKQNNIFATGE